MSVKEFILSGIIESYVLGTATKSEQREVERMAELHIEVREAISDYEEVLETFSSMHAVQPPASGKANFMDTIEEIAQDKVGKKTSSTISINRNKDSSTSRFWKILAVAAIIVLIISLGVNVAIFSKYNSSKSKIKKIAQNEQYLKSQNEKLKSKHGKVQKKLAVLLNPNIKQVVMKGVNHHPIDMQATIYWNKKNNSVYLGKFNLPAPPHGKAYQLWAIVNKKPVSLGMYNPKKVQGLKQMNKIHSKDISAFAITLEKEGGRKQPTMSQMYVLGSLS